MGWVVVFAAAEQEFARSESRGAATAASDVRAARANGDPPIGGSYEPRETARDTTLHTISVDHSIHATNTLE